jgi:hypothetical protein
MKSSGLYEPDINVSFGHGDVFDWDPFGCETLLQRTELKRTRTAFHKKRTADRPGDSRRQGSFVEKRRKRQS